MDFENKLARFMRNSGPARFFIPIGIILIIFGIITLGFKTDDFEQTTGKITSVTETVDSENQKQYDVDITYTVNGVEYTGQFPSLNGRFNEGDDIPVFYDPADPERITNSKISGFTAPLIIAVGAAALCFGVWRTVKAFKKSKALDAASPVSDAARTELADIKNAPGVTEYYFRYDGNTLKPGYLIESADRTVLFEGKMLKNALAGARSFEFSDHTTGKVQEHEVGHTVTSRYDNEFFSVSSWFKFDGENVWDLLHNHGLRMTTDLHSKFPHLIYHVFRDGAAFARIETSSIYVHEEDEAQHKLAIPYGKMYYRCWSASDDLESLFLTMFAISETEQTVVE